MYVSMYVSVYVCTCDGLCELLGVSDHHAVGTQVVVGSASPSAHRGAHLTYSIWSCSRVPDHHIFHHLILRVGAGDERPVIRAPILQPDLPERNNNYWYIKLPYFN